MRLAILTPDPAEPSFADYWPQLLVAYRRLFADAGVDLGPHPWTAGPPAGVDAAVALLAWGYHLDEPRWRRLLDDWPSSLPLVNARAILAWNTRKTYLADLAAAGVPVVPTQFVDEVSTDRVASAFARFGSDRLVVKPQISAGAHATVTLARGEPVPALRDAMIQPFLSSVGGEGELSLFYFGGELAHAVRKVAAPGEFRVQPVYGGRLELFTPDAEARSVAVAVLGQLPALPAYVRVDLVRDNDGRLAVMEVEALEPDLYLALAPQSGSLLVRAVLEAIARQAAATPC